MRRSIIISLVLLCMINVSCKKKNPGVGSNTSTQLIMDPSIIDCDYTELSSFTVNVQIFTFDATGNKVLHGSTKKVKSDLVKWSAFSAKSAIENISFPNTGDFVVIVTIVGPCTTDADCCDVFDCPLEQTRQPVFMSTSDLQVSGTRKVSVIMDKSFCLCDC